MNKVTIVNEKKDDLMKSDNENSNAIDVVVFRLNSFIRNENSERLEETHLDRDLKVLIERINLYMEWVRTIHIITNDYCYKAPDLGNIRINHVHINDILADHNKDNSNINVVGLNMYKIDGLSEKFVFFPSGTTITKKASTAYFFKNNLPCDFAREYFFETTDKTKRHILLNDILLINTKYSRKAFYKDYRSKAFSFKNIPFMIRNMYFSLLKRDGFFGFEEKNYPCSFLKKSFINLWAEFEEELESFCLNTTESSKDYDYNIVRFYQYVNGTFYPSVQIEKLYKNQ